MDIGKDIPTEDPPTGHATAPSSGSLPADRDLSDEKARPILAILRARAGGSISNDELIGVLSGARPPEAASDASTTDPSTAHAPPAGAALRQDPATRCNGGDGELVHLVEAVVYIHAELSRHTDSPWAVACDDLQQALSVEEACRRIDAVICAARKNRGLRLVTHRPTR